jgi:FKBP-type peptidyl-prolyl cis-trans isomerase
LGALNWARYFLHITMKISVLFTAVVLGLGLGSAIQAAPAKKTKAARVVTKPSGLKVQDFKIGKGKIAKAGQRVTVNYVGKLTNGTTFDQSYGRAPFSFALGAGDVIRGWDEGVAGMRVGGKRRLVIPAKLGYGAQGTPGGPIPPNATLVFMVELVGVG